MPSRSRKRLVAEPHWPSAHGVQTPAHSLGHDAGAAITQLMAQRQDRITCAVEWYRGFCQGCNSKPDPKVEAYIAREALADTLGLPIVSIIQAGLDNLIEGVEKVLGTDDQPKGART